FGQIRALGLELAPVGVPALLGGAELTSVLGRELLEPPGEPCSLGVELVEPLPLGPALLPQVLELLVFPLQLRESRRESRALGLQPPDCLALVIPLAARRFELPGKLGAFRFEPLERHDALTELRPLRLDLLQKLLSLVMLAPEPIGVRKRGFELSDAAHER